MENDIKEVIFRFGPEQYGKLCEIERRIGAKDKAEVLSHAISLLSWYLNEKHNGREIISRGKYSEFSITKAFDGK